jgi:hypothetical protein
MEWASRQNYTVVSQNDVQHRHKPCEITKLNASLIKRENDNRATNSPGNAVINFRSLSRRLKLNKCGSGGNRSSYSQTANNHFTGDLVRPDTGLEVIAKK